MNNNYTIKDLQELYEEAKHQRTCHAEQISGSWSISGEEFCNRYAFLNYDDACEEEEEYNRDAFYEELYRRKRQLKNLLGDEYSQLKEETRETIEDAIYDKLQNEFDFEEEGFYFWNDICNQIRNEITELRGEDANDKEQL